MTVLLFLLKFQGRVTDMRKIFFGYETKEERRQVLVYVDGKPMHTLNLKYAACRREYNRLKGLAGIRFEDIN